jgi:hypothetical protein
MTMPTHERNLFESYLCSGFATLSPILLFPCANLTLEVLAVLISLRRLLLGQCRLLQSPRDGPMPTTTRKLSNASYR